MKRAVWYGVLILAAVAIVVVTADTVNPFSRSLSLSQSSRSSLTFAVMGDTESHRELYQRMAQEAKQRGASFIVHTGDLSERGTEQDFKELQQTITGKELPVYAVPGNHDIRVDSSRKLFESNIGKVNRIVVRDGYSFVLLDNADRSIGFSPETLSWLAKELSQRQKEKFIFVFHRPFDLPLSAIVGDDETPPSRKQNREFLRIISDADIRAIFTGHLHIYLPYKLSDIPTYVSGGGGGEPQTALGSIGEQSHHFLLVHEARGKLNVEVIRLE